MKFIQAPKDHKFEVGQTIRLGGREMIIANMDRSGITCTFDTRAMILPNCLEWFPSLEVAIPSTTISREAYEELREWIKNHRTEDTFNHKGGVYYAVPHQLLIDKIKSMLPDESRGYEKV